MRSRQPSGRFLGRVRKKVQKTNSKKEEKTRTRRGSSFHVCPEFLTSCMESCKKKSSGKKKEGSSLVERTGTFLFAKFSVELGMPGRTNGRGRTHARKKEAAN